MRDCFCIINSTKEISSGFSSGFGAKKGPRRLDSILVASGNDMGVMGAFQTVGLGFSAPSRNLYGDFSLLLGITKGFIGGRYHSTSYKRKHLLALQRHNACLEVDGDNDDQQ